MGVGGFGKASQYASSTDIFITLDKNIFLKQLITKNLIEHRNRPHKQKLFYHHFQEDR